jgi:hypothetical protein
MKAIVDNKIVQKFHLILVVSTITLVAIAGVIILLAFAGVAGAMPEVEDVVGQLQEIVDDNPGTPLADKAEDALSKTEVVLEELAKPDYQAAVGNMEGAVGDLEAAVKDELLDADQGTEMMNRLSCAAWHLAAGAICQGMKCEGDADKITEALQALAEGEQLWLDEAYKDAVNKYKDALAKAEGEVSAPIDPLAGLITQDLVSKDGDLLGKALLYYAENTNETFIRLKCWSLGPESEYFVLLHDCDDDGNVTESTELGAFTTNGDGRGKLVGGLVADVTDCHIGIGKLSSLIDGPVVALKVILFDPECPYGYCRERPWPYDPNAARVFQSW